MKIAYISTSLPTACGIATFNNNLLLAINKNENIDASSFVVALTDNEKTSDCDYPPNVKFILRQNYKQDYLDAAKFINDSGADACILEHEFGIYGGDSGVYVLSLIASINVPVTVILHTVLKQPTFVQQTIIQQIAQRAKKIVVMSKKAIGFLTAIYGVKKDKIKYIEHGVPNLEPPLVNKIKLAAPFKDRKVLLTFGLISRNKGLETVIYALPEIIKEHPDVMYVILGNTHPGVIKNAGEEYRDSLIALAKKLKVENHLEFVKRFVDEEELHEYLCATDIYITPYLNKAQITSGTLSYAIGSGAAVISTPYWHAQELLSQQRGLLFDFEDHSTLSSLVVDLFNNPTELKKLKANAYEYGLKLRWPIIGKQFVSIITESIVENNAKSIGNSAIVDMDAMPPFDLSHIRRLTDDTGIIQHAKYGIPNLKEGYCLDDNARALIMALMAHNQFKTKEALEILPVYLSYIQYMQNEDGSFRNFLSFDRKFLDEVGSEDSFGRAIWSLGCLIKYAPNNSYREFGVEILKKSASQFKNLKHLRGIANTIIGLSLYLKSKPYDEAMRSELTNLVNPLLNAYKQSKADNWHWFEDKLTYDNGILPLALLWAYDVFKDEHILNVAMESLDFLTDKTMAQGYLNPVGNDGWLVQGKEMATYDQQAIETMAMVLVYFKSLELTKDVKYMHRLHKSYQWFLGENTLNLPLVDNETKGCADGLQPDSVNRNQGAESTLAYLISHLVVFKALEMEYDLNPDKNISQQILQS